jgi:Domain of unknown function (DUF4282)
VADELKTCANCGNTQATGAFCEACGTKLPAAAAAVATTPSADPAPIAQPVSPPPPPVAAQPVSPPPPPLGPYADITGKGFWARFFDLSFSDFITPSVIRVLFILFMVVIGLSFLGGVISGFMWSPALGVFAIIAGLIGGFVWLILARVGLEIVIVFFHIHDDTKEIAKSKR